MMNKHLSVIVIITLFALTACGKQSAPTNTSATTPIQKPEAGKATVTGKVFSTSTNKPLKTSVWLGQVYRQGDQVVYVVDAVSSPGIYADESGTFVLANVQPNEYVILIGDPEGLNEAVLDSNGKPKVWNILPDTITDTGELKVKLTK